MPPLGPHAVHIWYRPTDALGDAEHAQNLEVLNAEERERAARFLFPRDRVMFAAAHALLRRTLSSYDDVRPQAWTFSLMANGKPVLDDRHASSHLRFNLSHTRGLVACAVSRTVDLGIDVESVEDRTVGLDIAERFFSRNEVAGLSACAEADRHARFIELWTLKESYIKAIGEGLSHPLDTFGFQFDGAATLRFAPPPGVGAEDWQFALYSPSPGHRMALAARRATATPLEIGAYGELLPSGPPCILSRLSP